jgi:alanyl-tRNA synthetase
MTQVGELLAGAKVLAGTTTITALMPSGISADDLRKIATELCNRNANSTTALISVSDSRPVLVVATSQEARNHGVKAGALVKVGSTLLGGGGGGKDDVAQGGGTDASKVAEALSAIEGAIAGRP